MGRLGLHSLLTDIMGEEGKVYFQPPTNFKITYPCIVYQLSTINTKHANNDRYKNMTRYSVTLIYKDPDNPFIKKMLGIPYSSFESFFTADTLNHYVYTVYYK